ncbi:uncharacterized protein LOC129755402 isoform X3 [Uranotaenia lowii]|uniref:uncharacterized protein LOC129750716 isoform X3 n=1 Tax=Uranotaenia lowii TaxID=190385 RepID=UPI002479F94C|nr:uncharacterized protein LOC129750716 isoform X3 [Uranotaenia lowii]XP_055607835.1 uncharacterized protein LOC129755402 isoform X3 [Uranotaenia lowii]
MPIARRRSEKRFPLLANRNQRLHLLPAKVLFNDRSLSKTCPNWNRTTKMQSKSTTWKKGIIPSDRIHPATILHGFPLVQVCRIEARHLRRFSPPCIAGSQPARVIWFVQCPMWSLDDLISASRKMNDTSGSKGNIGEDVQDW